ncbi:MAG: hypothetical protein KKH41_08400 [Candidatus Thermoplasmatota archaeon]|nr:hypothetical protein [Euryarchaeota archaeon]MBU4032095.1 hypothetical protein [Candidatus Thermoplasmatota archaeon]MBU4072284.1 hypothetical protein [Candidatus Thermoplasmatota archaeon]MBU4144325.1 hypothetical protein [Candidatus Thermoplasmatota archaeon]MBU4592585.1 hypothetical protein [Candidatus Thermoplasmatota archaeon]
MKREDILLALKDAEEKTSNLIENAKKESDRNILKAKQDAAIRVDQGKGKTAELKERILVVKLASMEDKASIIRERGRLKRFMKSAGTVA